MAAQFRDRGGQAEQVAQPQAVAGQPDGGGDGRVEAVVDQTGLPAGGRLLEGYQQLGLGGRGGQEGGTQAFLALR